MVSSRALRVREIVAGTTLDRQATRSHPLTATEPPRAITPSLAHERELAGRRFRAVAGVDEVGRGAWGGRPPGAPARGAPRLLRRLNGVRDSKLLAPARREELLGAIEAVAAGIGIGAVSADELDWLGLGEANREAMRRAVAALPCPADFLLLDAFPLPGHPAPQRAIVRGDQECLSIAAASIVAKVTRDRALVALGLDYPAYGFDRHKGYGTPDHHAALRHHGPSPQHRLSFAPLRALPPAGPPEME
jgi:ribonuclease HII